MYNFCTVEYCSLWVYDTMGDLRKQLCCAMSYITMGYDCNLTYQLLVMQVHCDATIAFPLLVASTFARRFHGTNPTNWISGGKLRISNWFFYWSPTDCLDPLEQAGIKRKVFVCYVPLLAASFVFVYLRLSYHLCVSVRLCMQCQHAVCSSVSCDNSFISVLLGSISSNSL